MTSNHIHIHITQFEQDHISPDHILAEELSNPGSDPRYGVNIIAHPPQEIQDQILIIQQHLKKLNPNQYYYPAGDLHLTLLEICSSCPISEVYDIASIVTEHIFSILQGINPFQISFPTLVCDSKACALTFENNVPLLFNARKQMIEGVRKLGIDYRPRYFPVSAHITLMRYINALNQDTNTWIRHLELTPIKPNLVWNINKILITCGPTWYGRSDRINKAGPYELT